MAAKFPEIDKIPRSRYIHKVGNKLICLLGTKTLVKVLNARENAGDTCQTRTRETVELKK